MGCFQERYRLIGRVAGFAGRQSCMPCRGHLFPHRVPLAACRPRRSGSAGPREITAPGASGCRAASTLAVISPHFPGCMVRAALQCPVLQRTGSPGASRRFRRFQVNAEEFEPEVLDCPQEAVQGRLAGSSALQHCGTARCDHLYLVAARTTGGIGTHALLPLNRRHPRLRCSALVPAVRLSHSSPRGRMWLWVPLRRSPRRSRPGSLVRPGLIPTWQAKLPHHSDCVKPAQRRFVLHRPGGPGRQCRVHG